MTATTSIPPRAAVAGLDRRAVAAVFLVTDRHDASVVAAVGHRDRRLGRAAFGCRVDPLGDTLDHLPALVR